MPTYKLLTSTFMSDSFCVVKGALSLSLFLSDQWCRDCPVVEMCYYRDGDGGCDGTDAAIIRAKMNMGVSGLKRLFHFLLFDVGMQWTRMMNRCLDAPVDSRNTLNACI